ncbi:hypothetical protein [Sorangium sp. So ce1151]|uniref:hypothetical protein n=1 Tax=Sorangium sp. So ce1151 TaxID=3133332 RepID=UPI003F6322D2
MNPRHHLMFSASLLLAISTTSCMLATDYESETDTRSELVDESESEVVAQWATLTGKFIDENDWWSDGKVPGASIDAYSLEDNSFLGGSSTDQNGWYTLTGPFFQMGVRLVATPPTGARCPRGAETIVIFVDSVIKTHDFKDECQF